MGYVFACPVHPLGRKSRTSSRHLSVALTGCPRCHSRRGTGHDIFTGQLSRHFVSHALNLRAQTLSCLHVSATLAFSQIIGSVCVMTARATAPNRLGPFTVFPDASNWDFSEGLSGCSSQTTNVLPNLHIRQSCGSAFILGCPNLSSYDRSWLSLVLSQGTAWYAMTFLYSNN